MSRSRASAPRAWIFGRARSPWARFAATGVIAALGPLGAGFVYDRLGSYAPAWWLSAAFNVIALALLAFTHPPATLPRSPARRP